MFCRGDVRQANVFGESLTLEREIRIGLGGSTIELDDVVRNDGFAPTPHMILYHVNVGWPVLGEHAEVVAGVGEPRVATAREPPGADWRAIVAAQLPVRGAGLGAHPAPGCRRPRPRGRPQHRHRRRPPARRRAGVEPRHAPAPLPVARDERAELRDRPGARQCADRGSRARAIEEGTPVIPGAGRRGLLGIALHPGFTNNGYVYLYWTESSTGVDSTNLQDVALLGNRVDRYVWNGSTLVFDRNLIKLHAFQADANQPLRGNHNGGVLRFGPDGKLFIMMGDNGRRGFLQNVTSGAPVPDDQFGGPEPDNAHLTGFILRLNDDGSTPSDNPFFNASTSLTGEAAANIKKLFAYGVRNGFGLAFDPLSGNLWDQENGDDAFDEMNRVTAGSNNGWIQIMGPVSRISQFKQIETTYGTGDLQQLRWSPSLIADTPADALSRLYMLPGAHYNDPEFSWKYAVPAAPFGFVQGRGVGPQFEGDMFVGSARTFLAGGFLFRFKLTPDRLHFSFTDSRLTDLVADNLDKFDITESESLLIGKDFGITTDIETGPNGNVFVVSNTNSAVYEISGKQPTVFLANLNGAQEVPLNNSTATGTATLLLSPDESSARLSLNFNGLTSPETVAHIHGPAATGIIGPVLFPIPQGDLSDVLLTLGPSDVQNLRNGLLYIDIHSNAFTAGEIRGQFQTSTVASSVQFNAATFRASESAGAVNVQVTRMGDTSGVATVDYQTLDDPAEVRCDVLNGTAYARCDYATKRDTLTFAPAKL